MHPWSRELLNSWERSFQIAAKGFRATLWVLWTVGNRLFDNVFILFSHRAQCCYLCALRICSSLLRCSPSFRFSFPQSSFVDILWSKKCIYRCFFHAVESFAVANACFCENSILLCSFSWQFSSFRAGDQRFFKIRLMAKRSSVSWNVNKAGFTDELAKMIVVAKLSMVDIIGDFVISW